MGVKGYGGQGLWGLSVMWGHELCRVIMNHIGLVGVV